MTRRPRTEIGSNVVVVVVSKGGKASSSADVGGSVFDPWQCKRVVAKLVSRAPYCFTFVFLNLV
jgi:hypothetical protein